MTPQEQLQDLLRELFQLNNPDLDFGIYRILNLKHKEVEEFITSHLPKRIEQVREKILARQSVDLRAEIEHLKQQLSANFQVDFNKEGDLEAKASQYGQLQLFKEPHDKYIEAKKKLDALHVSEDTERAIYNELYRFFDRYYEGGDFISKPRAGANNYMIPYNGEEVKLYWANYDQYYIKTSENFKNYVFTNNSASPENRITVEFKIVDAETTTNNNKDEKKRLFVPTEKPIEWNADERKLTVSFYYKEPSADEKAKWGEKQSVKKEGKGINQHLYAELEKVVKKTKDSDLLRLWESKRRTSRDEEVPLFLYHLNRYTSINSFDYFIHKDLKGFLRRELDYFLKNEVLSVNFLDPDWKENEVQEAIKLNILKASAIRDLALTIIDFLGELEDFQKRLWEKKKFVVQSDYCLTLDTITDEAVLAEVLDSILNDKEQKQINEWKKLNFIADKRELKDLQKKLKNGETNLKYLVLDTQFLPEALKWKLLASIDNLDERTNGLLINSENWQALNVLLNKYRKRVECVHMDPPYNTDTSGFLYKNSYQHSSWLAMMENRCKIASYLISESGHFLSHVDENEYERLKILMDRIGIPDAGTVVWDKRNPMTARRGIATQHEYIIWRSYAEDSIYQENSNISEMLAVAKSIIKKHNGITQEARKEYADWVRTNPRLSGGEKAYCYIDEKGNVYRPVSLRAPEPRTDPKFFQPLIHPITNKPCAVPPNGFSRTPETLQAMIQRGEILFGPDESTQPQQKRILTEESKMQIRSIIQDAKKGKEYLDVLGLNFPYCHPVSLYEQLVAAPTSESEGIVLDHFAGSATTAHAVINLNREDGGNRKYILVEMGAYFDTVLKPRVQKVIFSDKWKEGKPQEDGKGISQIFQYLKLEQYEDTLNNIEFTKDAAQLTMVDRLRYLLTYGTAESDCLLNVGKFTNPFGYTMRIVRQNEIVPDQPIDLVTTFNYFLGIDLKRYVIEKHQGREYRIVLGKKRQQEYIIIWRPYDEQKLDLTEEREWIKKQSWYSTEALVYCNAENGFGALSTEAEFLRIMNEPVE